MAGYDAEVKREVWYFKRKNKKIKENFEKNN